MSLIARDPDWNKPRIGGKVPTGAGPGRLRPPAGGSVPGPTRGDLTAARDRRRPRPKSRRQPTGGQPQ